MPAGYVRVRGNGLVVDEDSLLMVRLFSPVADQWIWMPPGGGVQFGESLESAVCREISEETGIRVEVDSLWYLNEILSEHIHAIEFYYMCNKRGGRLRTGSDPEYSDEGQIIRDVGFIPFDQLDRQDVYPEYLRKYFVTDYQSAEPRFPKII